jgi:hypothetical protein
MSAFFLSFFLPLSIFSLYLLYLPFLYPSSGITNKKDKDNVNPTNGFCQQGEGTKERKGDWLWQSPVWGGSGGEMFFLSTSYNLLANWTLCVWSVFICVSWEVLNFTVVIPSKADVIGWDTHTHTQRQLSLFPFDFLCSGSWRSVI